MIENLQEQQWIAELVNKSYGGVVISVMIVGTLWCVLKPVVYFWDRYDAKKEPEMPEKKRGKGILNPKAMYPLYDITEQGVRYDNGEPTHKYPDEMNRSEFRIVESRERKLQRK